MHDKIFNVKISTNFMQYLKNFEAIFNALRALHATPSSYEKVVSVRLSNGWIVTKRKKDLSGFLYHYEKPFSLVF